MVFLSTIMPHEIDISLDLEANIHKGEKADPEIPGSRWILLDPSESQCIPVDSSGSQ